MIRFSLLAMAVGLGLASSPIAVLAQDGGRERPASDQADNDGGEEETFAFKTEEEEEIEAISELIANEMGLLTDFFSADPLTQEQEARLPRRSSWLAR